MWSGRQESVKNIDDRIFFMQDVLPQGGADIP
jgi:hypothetical protein